jgi:acetoin utilization deacetylase AcuC-like enzyme
VDWWTHSLVSVIDRLPGWVGWEQRPHKALFEDMTKYHSDEYMNFLKNISPETAAEQSKHMTRCTFLLLAPFAASHAKQYNVMSSSQSAHDSTHELSGANWCTPIASACPCCIGLVA